MKGTTVTLSDKQCPIGVPFGHAVCVAIEETQRMQAINDEGDEPNDYDVRRLLLKIERDLIEVQRLASR